jgi:hypothetical protein
MRGWRALIVISLLASLAVILATAYLEATGRLRLPWPMLAPQMGTRLGWLGAPRLAAAGPYVEAAAGLLLQFLIGTLILYVMPERMRRLTDAVAEESDRALPGDRRSIGAWPRRCGAAFRLLRSHAFLPFVLGGILFLVALAGGEALALALGRGLLRRADWSTGSPLVALLVGTTLLYAVTRLPYIASVLMALLGLVGAGAALSTRFGGRRTWTLDPLREVMET